jgi:hypothetical protein
MIVGGAIAPDPVASERFTLINPVNQLKARQ